MAAPNQLFARSGYMALKSGVRYHRVALLGRDMRVLFASFSADPRPSFELKVLSQADYVSGLQRGCISHAETSITMPPWLASLEDKNFDRIDLRRTNSQIEHRVIACQRHSQVAQVLQAWPKILLQKDIIVAMNRVIRTIEPRQNETRVRLWVFTYLAFGHNVWALLPSFFNLPEQASLAEAKGVKRGRPSKDGSSPGFNCDAEMVERCLTGYRMYAKQGDTLTDVYAEVLEKQFGCSALYSSAGEYKVFHPLGEPFPSIGQFRYHVAQNIGQREIDGNRLGKTRARNEKQAPKGSYFEEVAYLMEKFEVDAFTVEAHPSSIATGKAAPKLYVVRIRCLCSGCIVGIGFGYGSEDAEAYKSALFCACVDKVYFCKLFGITIKAEQWTSMGLGLEYIPDRGSGSCEAVVSKLKGLVSSVGIPPTSEPQSHAAIESSHPRSKKAKGIKKYKVSRCDVIGLARKCILDVIAYNANADCTSRLTIEMAKAGVVPTPNGIWNFLEKQGRNAAQPVDRNTAIRLFTTPVSFKLQKGKLMLETLRYSSKALEATGVLERSRVCDAINLEGYGLSLCMREAWVCIGMELIDVDVRMRIRCGKDELYAPFEDLKLLGEATTDGKSKAATRKAASRLYSRLAKKDQIPNANARSQVRKGHASVRSSVLRAEKDIIARRQKRACKR